MTSEEIKLKAIIEKHSSFATAYSALQDGIHCRNLADRSKWANSPTMVDRWQNQALRLGKWAGFYAEGHLYVGPGFVLIV